MPAASLSAFDLGPGRVVVGAGGCRVTHPARPGFDYLTGDAVVPTVVLAGVDRPPAPTGEGADLDEVELTYALGASSGLRLTVRHSFGATWVQRYTLAAGPDEPVALDGLRVGIGTGPDLTGGEDGQVWVLAAGAEAFWTSQPADGAGPVLAAVLQHGEITGFSDERGRPVWSTGPVSLAPGERYVVQWQLDWHASAAAFERRRPSVLPRRTELPVGEPCEIAGADAAVVAGPEVAVGAERGPSGEVSVLIVEEPGRHPVELRSSRGTVRFDVTWFRTASEWVAAATEGWLAGPRTSSGVVRLPGPAAGLVLQADHHRLADPDGDAVEALDRLAAGMLDGSPADIDVLGLALLAGEALRTGDPDLAAAARDGVLARRAPEPGLGLAATRVGLAGLAAGRGIGELIAHLAELADRPVIPSSSADPVRAVAARLELTLISRPHGAVVDGELLALVRELATAAGCGLPGGPARPWSPDRCAYVAAVLAMVPEQGAARITRWSLRGPQALADLVRRRALAGLTALERPGDELTAATLAWLVLGQPPV